MFRKRQPLLEDWYGSHQGCSGKQDGETDVFSSHEIHKTAASQRQNHCDRERQRLS